MKILAALLALSLMPVPQETVTALRHRAPSGTNIQFQGYAKFNTSTTQSSLSGAYTCASTSNRLIIVSEYQNVSGGVTDLTLSDTGGQASGATVIYPFTTNTTVFNKAWNSGCASGSNTYTVTQVGPGAAGIVLEIVEYSGITSGAGTNTTNNITSNVNTYPATAGTASSNGTLAVIYVGMGEARSLFNSITAGYNYRTTNTGSGGDGGIVTSYPMFDNINVPTGTVNFTMTAGSGTPITGHVILFLLTGSAATSPNWGPTFFNSGSHCNTSTGNSVSTPFNVTSGDLITYAYKNETNSTPSSVTDNQGNTYTFRVTKAVGSANFIWIYTAVAGSSGALTVTANGSSLNFPCSQVSEFAGPGQNVTDTGGQTTSSGTMTWTQTVSFANSIVYAVCGSFHSSSTFTMTGFQFNSTSQGNGADAIGGSWARTVSTSSVTPIFGISTSDSNVCASITVH